MSKNLLTEKKDLYKIYENDLIYISRKDYSTYKDIVYGHLFHCRDILLGICVDHENDTRMCYARITHIPTEEAIGELERYSELDWLVTYIKIFKERENIL